MANSNNETDVILQEALDKLDKKGAEERKEREAKAKEWVKEIQQMIVDDYKEFSFNVCNWTLDSKTKSKSKTDLKLNLADQERIYGDLARFVLRKLETDGEENQEDVVGFVSARDWIESEVGLQQFIFPEDFNSAYLNDICHTFFRRYIDEIGNQSAMFNYMVFFGVPVYTLHNKNYKLLDETTELFGYLKGCGRYFQGFNQSSMPDWVDCVFINVEHVEWCHKLDTDVAMSALDENQQEILRARYRQMIGVPYKTNVSDFAYGTGSKLSKLVQEVVIRYYSMNFDINDSDTWAKQKDIVEWLIAEHRLSKREAEAIDLVTRPDVARNK